MIDNDTRPGPPGGVMLICPINGCPWRYERTQWPRGPAGAVVTGLTPQEAIAAVTAAVIAEDERECREHLATHPLEDFLRTIAQLRAQLAEHTAG